MMLRTHLALTFAAIFLFIPYVSNQFVFVIAALVTVFIPDIDSAFSFLGDSKGGKFIQFFVKHRGILHSLTFCLAISFVLAFFIPVLALPFFLSYSIHIFSDSFTKKGVTPFWPSQKVSKWNITTGGIKETGIFVFVIILDLILLFFALGRVL